MKRITLLATTALLFATCMGGLGLTAHAAPVKKICTTKYGQMIVIRPCPPLQIPGCNIPVPELPEQNQPENEAPETNAPDTNTPENNETLSYVEQVVKLVNIERAKKGLNPLTVDTKVQAAAQVRARECEQSFSHTRPNGSNFSTALREQGVSYRRSGENIAWGQRTPEEVVNAWMNSSGHRANILNRNFTKIGVGYYQNNKGVKYWSQLFIG